MLDRLDDGYRRLMQFSADLAHEIRTPVGSLMGHCQVALRQNRSVDEYQALLASNLEELERVSRLVESILFLARADEAQAALERQSLDLHDELQRVAGYFEGLAEERDLTLSIHGHGTLRADPILLRRALSNLVANAIRYADENSEIQLRVAVVDRTWRIDVQNRGRYCRRPPSPGCSTVSTVATLRAMKVRTPMVWVWRLSQRSCICMAVGSKSLNPPLAASASA